MGQMVSNKQKLGMQGCVFIVVCWYLVEDFSIVAQRPHAQSGMWLSETLNFVCDQAEHFLLYHNIRGMQKKLLMLFFLRLLREQQQLLAACS